MHVVFMLVPACELSKHGVYPRICPKRESTEKKNPTCCIKVWPLPRSHAHKGERVGSTKNISFFSTLSPHPLSFSRTRWTTHMFLSPINSVQTSANVSNNKQQHHHHQQQQRSRKRRATWLWLLTAVVFLFVLDVDYEAELRTHTHKYNWS